MAEKHSAAKAIIGGLFGGFIMIWLGVSFYLVMSGFWTWGQWGAWFCLGLAALFLLQGIAWLAIPGMHKSFVGMLIPAVFLTAIGIVPIIGNGWDAWGKWWPLIIVAVGLVIIISTISTVVSKRKRKEVKIE